MPIFTYVYLSGGIDLNSPLEKNYSQWPVILEGLGELNLSGSSQTTKNKNYSTSAGIKLSSNSIFLKSRKFTSSGKIKIGGTTSSRNARNYVGSGKLKVSGTFTGLKKLSIKTLGKLEISGYGGYYAYSERELIGTTSTETICTIGIYSIFWKHARELNANVSTENTTEFRKLTITGRGMTPPPFSVDSFSQPVDIFFQKQDFEPIQGTFYLTNVSIELEENEAWWNWSVEGFEVPNISLTVNGITLTWNQAREITATYGLEDSTNRTIQISGRGIVPPPFGLDSFSDPVIITYTKENNIFTGTFDIKSVSVSSEGNEIWWNWSLEGEQLLDDNADSLGIFTIDGVTLTREQAKELDASISTESTTEPRTLSASGRGSVPPPFEVDSYTTPVEIIYSKNGTSFSGIFYISSISIQGEQEANWWSWSVEGTEIVPATCSINGTIPTWDQARELTANIELDILGLKQISISGRGIVPIGLGPYSSPITISYTKDGSGFTGVFFVTGTSLEGESDGQWWSWGLEALEITTATCSINGISPSWSQARELTANYSTDEDGIKSISINGRGTVPFYPTLSTEPVYITYTKEGYGFAGYFTITSTSVDSAEDAWWEWSVEGKEKSDEAGNRAYITIGTLFTYDQAREINASIEDLKAIYAVRSGSGSLIMRSAWTGKHTISVSGRGIVPPPLLNMNIAEPLPVVYSKGGSGFSGTYFLTESSVEGEDDGKWWSWSVQGEEV
jgi:hypothetical protein